MKNLFWAFFSGEKIVHSNFLGCFSRIPVTSKDSTNMSTEYPPFQNVVPIENGGFSICHVSFQGCVYIFSRKNSQFNLHMPLFLALGFTLQEELATLHRASIEMNMGEAGLPRHLVNFHLGSC